jgi:transcriptional regulator with XRE-family HTH domain
MPEHMDITIGTRLREVRKRRGLTQQALAEASEVSPSLISKLERGDLNDTRMETAHRLARALRVPTSALLTRDAQKDSDTAELWRPLKEAVERPPVQPDEEPTMDGIRAGLQAVRAAHIAKRLADEVTLLVPLLRDAEALGDDREARTVRAELLRFAGSTLTTTHQYEAAETALQRALDEAPDRIAASTVVTTWAWLLTRQGRLAEARDMAQKWVDDSEPRFSRATPGELAAWGWLLLQGAAACLRDNRGGEASSMMRLARAASVASGKVAPDGIQSNPWGPTVVAYKACERGVVLERPEEVLKAAERLQGTGAGQMTDYHRHRLDVAKAHVMVRQYSEAVEVLAEVHAESPEWLAQQRYARDILGDVIERRRTLTPETRTLADAIGVPL